MDATVTTLVTDFSNGEADLTAAQEFYDDIVANYLAEIPILTNYSTALTVTGNTAALPSTSVNPMAVFYNNEQIGVLTVNEANFLLPDWRETPGVPRNYVDDGASNRSTILLAPLPFTAPAYTVQSIYSETRQTLPTYLALPVAMLILYYEYSKESQHRNEALATAYKAMGEFLISTIIASQ